MGKVQGLLIAAVLFGSGTGHAQSPGFDEQPRTILVPVQASTGLQRPAGTPSPPAEYHKAVLQVTAPDNSGGSCCVIQTTGGGCFALTNHHVVSKGFIDPDRDGVGYFAKDTFPTVRVGGPRTGKPMSVVWADDELDLALLHSPSMTVGAKVPLAESMPPIGTMLELCGYGGPVYGKLNHTLGKRTQSGGFRCSLEAFCFSGDSGGPILHNGQLVGVNCGARAGQYGSHEGWKKYYPASSHADVEDIAAAIQPYIERSGGKLVRGGNPQDVQAEQLVGACPPSSGASVPQIIIRQADIDKSVEKYLKCNPPQCPPGEPGSPGKPGQPGPPGEPGKPCDCDCEAIIAEVLKRMPKQYIQAGYYEDGEMAAYGKPIEIPRDGTPALIPPFGIESIGNGAASTPQQAPLGSMIPLQGRYQLIE